MESMTHRVSTIIVSQGDGTHVFHSLEEIPPSVRERVLESTNGELSGTVIIADRNGREEIARVVQGRSDRLQFRVTSTPQRRRERKPAARHPAALPWVELALVGSLGLVAWLLFLIK